MCVNLQEAIGFAKKSLFGWRHGSDAKKVFKNLVLVNAVMALFQISILAFVFGTKLELLIFAPEKIVNLEELLANAGFMNLPAMALTGIASLYIYFLCTRNALKENNLKAEKLDLKKFMQGILLSAGMLFGAMFSLFDKKMILILIASVAAFFASATEPLLGYLGGALAIIYLLIIMRNLARLSLSFPAFMSVKSNFAVALKESWRLSKGKTIPILLGFAGVIVPLILADALLGTIFFELGKIVGGMTGIALLHLAVSALPRIFVSAYYGMSLNYLAVIFYADFEDKQ